jgi:hypothetical protein
VLHVEKFADVAIFETILNHAVVRAFQEILIKIPDTPHLSNKVPTQLSLL